MGISQTGITVGTTAVQILGTSATRHFASICLLTDGVIVALGAGTNAIAGQGMILTARGSNFQLTKDIPYGSFIRAASLGTGPAIIGVVEW